MAPVGPVLTSTPVKPTCTQQHLTPCPWAKGEDYLLYHDTEWGQACRDRNQLFEKLCLEGQQAGLSWITVLRKRNAYRHYTHQFNPEKLALMSDAKLNQLAQNPKLIRHKLKIYSLRNNAQALLKLEAQGIDFVDFIWSFVNGNTQINHFASLAEVPSQTPTSKAMSQALKRAGFSFVGPTSCYAFMQSQGLVNDHLTNCPRHPANLSRNN